MGKKSKLTLEKVAWMMFLETPIDKVQDFLETFGLELTIVFKKDNDPWN